MSGGIWLSASPRHANLSPDERWQIREHSLGFHYDEKIMMYPYDVPINYDGSVPDQLYWVGTFSLSGPAAQSDYNCREWNS